jgi:hypothetical protein
MARRRTGSGPTINQTRGLLYRVARIMGDVQSVQQGRVGQRVGRRVTGRATGRAMRRLFR